MTCIMKIINGSVFNRTYEEREKRLHDMYTKFERGDYSAFKGLINWATTIIGELKAAKIKFDDERIVGVLEQYMTGVELEKDIEEWRIIHILLEREGELPEHALAALYLKLQERKEMHFLKENHVSEIARYEELLNRLKLYNTVLYEKLESRFLSLGLKNVWNECVSIYEYDNRELPIWHVMFLQKFGLYSIIEKFSDFKRDLFVSSKLIQNQAKVLNVMRDGASLKRVCDVIRGRMNIFDPKLGVDIREGEMNGGWDDFMSINSPSSKDLPLEFEELSKEYDEVMKEPNKEAFIRKCADFHFDFLRVHPFPDGNGRTSRILLSSMLASRDVFMPSLYTDYSDKEYFYRRSDEALNGNYKITENDIFMRLGYFWPSVLPHDEINDEGVTK